MTRRTPLVCEHLENLSSEVLAQYADIIRDMVGRRHGIYALYRRRKLYYVGLASNLRNRIRHHLKDRHGGKWDRFSVYLTLDVGHMKELESLMLRIVKPDGNTQKGRFARSVNLQGELSRRATARYRRDLRAMMGRTAPGLDREKHSGSEVVKGAPVLAKHAKAGLRLRGVHRGAIHKAIVRKDGSIKYGKQVFRSPSLAAAAAVRRRSCNGWSFWQFERAPGLWVKLSELRRR